MRMRGILRWLSSQNDRGFWPGSLLGLGTGFAIAALMDGLMLAPVMMLVGLSLILVNVVRRLPRYQHLKRGSTYRVLGTATLQTGQPLDDFTPLTVYRSESDGELWARPTCEFNDGRFRWL